MNKNQLVTKLRKKSSFQQMAVTNKREEMSTPPIDLNP